MVPYENHTLYNALKELGVIDETKLDTAYKTVEKNKAPLGEELLRQELISDDNLGKVVADLVKKPFINLSQQKINESVLKIVPELVAKKQKIILFDRNEEGTKLAMVDPTNEEIPQLISKKTGDKVKVYYATDRSIEEALHLYRKGLQQAFDEMLTDQVEEANDAIDKGAPVEKIVDTLLQYAQQNKASDVHIEPEEKESIIRFRIDGVLHDVLTVSKDLHDQVVTRIKVLSRLRTDEHMSAQDGKMKLELENETLDIRVSIVPIVEGEKCVMRLLSSRSRQFSLQDLGMSGKDLEKVKKAYANPHGMILATGPTGSGKTTTIYSVLKILNSRDVNIATIEDPVEYDIEGVNQIQANPKTNLTFADGLRAILRQDPDIIFVGEIRDAETAGIATNSAMTGHLVLSTLHTNDAATTLPRLIDMEIEPFLVASTVNIIIAQRLIRKICDKCKVSINMPRTEIETHYSPELLNKHFGEKQELRVYKGKGCEVCHDSGYRGRVGVFEILEVSPVIKGMIVEKVDSDQIATQARKEGMTTMLEDGLNKVALGVTTFEEVSRVTQE